MAKVGERYRLATWAYGLHVPRVANVATVQQPGKLVKVVRIVCERLVVVEFPDRTQAPALQADLVEHKTVKAPVKTLEEYRAELEAKGFKYGTKGWRKAG